jgi:AcrR family transcriptional regulator
MTTLAQDAAHPRDRILENALECFLEVGYEQTTVARICERSGVSNGTLFHYFSTKEAISDALYLESIADFQDGLWLLSAARPRSLRSAVRGVIAHQIEWIEDNVDRARFVYTRGTLDGDSPGYRELEEMNRKVAHAYQQLLDPFIERGHVRPMSMLVLNALVTGPTHAIARRWLAGHIDGSLQDYVDELADAAAAALSGTPVRPRHRAPASHEGRLRIELLSEEGSVVGRGEATAEIRPVGSH